MSITAEKRVRKQHGSGARSSTIRCAIYTRARMTQIMNLLHLAPDIQEELLCLPKTVQGRDPYCLQGLRVLAQTVDWEEQREMWRAQQGRAEF